MLSGCGQLQEVLFSQLKDAVEAGTNSEEAYADNEEVITDGSEADIDSGEADTDSKEEDLVEVTLGQYSGSYSASDEYERCSLEVTVIEGAVDVNLICRKGQENWASGVISGNSFSAGITGYDEYYRTGDLNDLKSGKIDVTFNDSSATVTVKWEEDEEANTYEMKRISDDAGKTIEITREIYEQYLGYLE
jgi:hypothetical protein